MRCLRKSRRPQGGVPRQALSQADICLCCTCQFKSALPLLEVVAAVEVPGKRMQGKLIVPETFHISSDTKFDGAFLRQARESCEATLEDVAEITKIGKHYLRAIEENDFDRLPAPVYVRGFVAEYARVLSLNSQDVSKHYMELFRAHRS